jgi:hypothetical protein
LKFKVTAPQLYFGRLGLDLILLLWHTTTLTSTTGGQPKGSVLAEPMLWLGITNPVATLLATMCFGGPTDWPPYVWVLLFLLTSAIFWGGVWYISRWLKS